ncbi:hypothetical protein IC744_10905 [Microbacterium hominis]|uniref:hypothetical protein n=1 Tax=Microbacterium hominis TaxID=162426 RepID=UPI00168BD3B9|nr:hypothetical protein [Microbacterium hominis]QOC27966.1 hypothetical protein IC744_10905 [Microbacterium hominis]
MSGVSLSSVPVEVPVARAETSPAVADPVAGQNTPVRVAPMSRSSERLGSVRAAAGVGVDDALGDSEDAGSGVPVVAKFRADMYGSRLETESGSSCPAANWVARSASPNWSAKREFGSASRSDSHC